MFKLNLQFPQFSKAYSQGSQALDPGYKKVPCLHLLQTNLGVIFAESQKHSSQLEDISEQLRQNP